MANDKLRNHLTHQHQLSATCHVTQNILQLHAHVHVAMSIPDTQQGVAQLKLDKEDETK